MSGSEHDTAGAGAADAVGARPTLAAPALAAGAAPRVVVMGVSGCGTSTVGALLAGVLGVPFVDADALYPRANVERMAAGIALTDEDRGPWLQAVGEALASGPDGAVVACSALRRTYRDRLRGAAPDAVMVHLDGPRERLAERLTARLDHFMPAALLDSQLATLEPLEADERGLVLSIEHPPAALAAAAAAALTGFGARAGATARQAATATPAPSAWDVGAARRKPLATR